MAISPMTFKIKSQTEIWSFRPVGGHFPFKWLTYIWGPLLQEKVLPFFFPVLCCFYHITGPHTDAMMIPEFLTFADSARNVVLVIQH